ncbi:hypothetical protein ACH4UT_32020 [Streptomyces sp. NPDC020799]|uniref:hypothetical protein n=1 Tax=Streptomyces sp. NPDC020799 TaxID=3365091 RepID=UPI0037BB8686
MWGKQRFRTQAQAALRSAAPLWEQYAAAHARMETAFAAFRTTADTRWRAQLLTLADAQREALAAAGRWDAVAEGLAQIEHERLRTVGEEYALRLHDVAPDFGLDIGDWDISCLDDYQRPKYHYGEFRTPLVWDLDEEIKRQREQLQEVADLAGDRAAVGDDSTARRERRG